MSTRLIICGVIVGFSFMVFNGVLMLMSPATHRRFLVRLGETENWFHRDDTPSLPPRREPQSGLEIERRVAGFGLAAMGIYVLWNGFGSAYIPSALIKSRS